jgi:hypothetical protein
VSVPATLQATIAACIDRLRPEAKRTLSAAAVIGSRFGWGLLETLGVEPAVDDLVAGQLIDQVSFTRRPEYVFRHPLIRAVAYQSQLKSDRAELHRRLAAAIESRDPAAVEENAALIAEHLETAADLHAAYGWHMRAATWATSRDIRAAQLSWERATKIADALAADDPNRAAMRIAPRAMLCAIAIRVHLNVAGDRFEELRQLCTAAGEGVTGHRHGGAGDGSRLSGPGARGVAAGIGSDGPHRVDRRCNLDSRAVFHRHLHQDRGRRV